MSHSADVKSAAMAALLTGQSVSSVAREYQLPKGTVSGWKKQAFQRVRDEATQTTPAHTRVSIGERLLDYLDASLEALKQQAKVFADPAWLAKQDASELAVLHGVQTDKAVRLLEALGGPGEVDAGDAS